MNNRQKVINAIRNMRTRSIECIAAEKALEQARQNMVNARKDVIRQIKNAFGAKSVAFEQSIYSIDEDELKIRPLDVEILQES